MNVKLRPIAKSKKVMVSTIITFLTILWNIVDEVSNVEFVIQKLGYQNEVTNFLTSPAAPKVAFFLAISALVASLIFEFEKTPSKELNPLETPEYDLTPNRKIPEKKTPKLEEKQEIAQPKPVEIKPQKKTVVSNPPPEIVEPPKINIPEIKRAGFQMLFRQGKPYIETNKDSRNLSLEIENKTGGHMHRVKVRAGNLVESKEYGHKSILLNPTISYYGGLGFQISNGGKYPLGIASQSISDPQDVRFHLYCLNPISTATFFWSIEFTVSVEAKFVPLPYTQFEHDIILSKSFVLYIDEQDLLQLKEIEVKK